ncbi:MAG: antitoxin [Ignavibacteriales bacterium]|nr:antitoxin [Ignavibacteriales bacterium]
METAKLFTNGNSQAVRLPKSFRFEGKEVNITRVGDAVILLPQKKKWDSLLQSLGKFSEDFLAEREQPELEKREDVF